MINKQKIEIHDNKNKKNNTIRNYYGYSPILDPVVKISSPIALCYGLRCNKVNTLKQKISMFYKEIHMSAGVINDEIMTLKSFSNSKETKSGIYYNSIAEAHKVIYDSSEIINYNLSSITSESKKISFINDVILSNMKSKITINLRGPMNIIMVGKNIEKYIKNFIYSYTKTNDNNIVIEYEDNKLIGKFNNGYFYSDQYIDDNAIYMTYISKEAIIDRGLFPVSYENDIQIINPFNDVEKYSTFIKFY